MVCAHPMMGRPIRPGVPTGLLYSAPSCIACMCVGMPNVSCFGVVMVQVSVGSDQWQQGRMCR